MKNHSRFIQMIFFTLCLAQQVHAANASSENYQMKMIANLETASVWLVQNGVEVYTQVGSHGLFELLKDRWGVQLWVEPSVNQGRYLALFSIKARGIHHDVQMIWQHVFGEDTYEYWIIKIRSLPWAGVKSRTLFLLTKTQTPLGPREIVKQQNTFFSMWRINRRWIFELPTQNLQMLYDMQPRDFPENYRGSVLENQSVILDDKGHYQLIR